MAVKLIIDGNAVYEIDEECLENQKKRMNFSDGSRNGRFRKSEDKPNGYRQDSSS